jgi:hypothetical protein
MLAKLAWVVLHAGDGHNDGGLGFEVWLGSLVTLLVLVGALWYLGVFESLGPDAEVAPTDGDHTEADSEVGD